MAKRRRYTDQFRANAVLMLESQGYPDKDGALAKVSRKLDVPHSTLHRWFHKKQNPPPSDLVQHIKKDLVDAIEDEMASILVEMKSAREDSAYNQLGVVFGILVDKRQLLSGAPTEIHKHDIDDAKERLDRRIAGYASRSGKKGGNKGPVA